MKAKTSLGRREAGLATLLTAVTLLFLATILGIFVSRTTVMEQRISANEVRHKAAFEAAQAGLDAAIVFVSTGVPGVDKNNDGVVDAAPAAALGNGTNYRTAFCQPVAAPAATCPANRAQPPVCGAALQEEFFSIPRVVSCGWSDDGLAQTLMQKDMGVVVGLAKGPENPLIARGAVNVSGSANVVNYFTNLTIWSGRENTNVGNSGKTFIRNPNVPPPAVGTVPPGEPNSCTTTVNYVCVTDKNTKGPDVIDDDPTLRNLSTTDLFRNFFGYTSLDDYKEEVATDVISAANAGTLAGRRGEIIVVEGDTVLPNAVIGTRNRPVVLIIEGDLRFQGNPTVYGIVYVTGDVAGGGNPTIWGSMIVAGAVGNPADNKAMTGSVDIIFDPYITGNAATSTGRPGWIAGSWRDW